MRLAPRASRIDSMTARNARTCSAMLVGHVGGVGALDDVDAQRAARRLGAAELGAVQGAQRDAAVPVRQHRRLALDHGDDADACEAAFVARHEHDLAVLRLGRAQGLVHGSVGLCRGEVE